jgi:hypothetical protein
VFERFREARLKLNPRKYQLLQKEVKYLGHIVSPEEIPTDPEKLKAGENGKPLRISTKLEAFWAYARTTGDLFPVSPTSQNR